MKHVVCFSGGHSSGIVAIEVARKFGKEDVILLNHDINPDKEDADIKRFKKQVADYVGIPITYANYRDITNPDKIPDQFDIVMQEGTLTERKTQQAICTSRLKTEPFMDYLQRFHLKFDNLFGLDSSCIIYYGFDMKESTRINRRYHVLGALGYKTDFPLATWKERTIYSTREVGIEPSMTYEVFEHANCVGCLKASLLHWYVTFVHRQDVYSKGELMEAKISFTIHTIIRSGVKQSISLAELRPIFERMKCDGVVASEHQSKSAFAALIRKYQLEEIEPDKPCECVT